MTGGTRSGGRPSLDRVVIQELPVERIRPEDGLGRKRDRVGHDELCQSVRQFGVLTPVTVRPAPDGSGDYQPREWSGPNLGLPAAGPADGAGHRRR